MSPDGRALWRLCQPSHEVRRPLGNLRRRADHGTRFGCSSVGAVHFVITTKPACSISATPGNPGHRTVPAVYMRDAASSGWGFWPGLSRSSGETIPLEMIILKPSSIVRSVTIMVSAGTSCRKARGRVRRRGDQNLGEFAALAVLHISGQETNRLQTRTGEIHHDDGLECGVMGLRQGLDHLLGGAADAPGQRNPQPDAFSDGDQPASDDMLAEPANEVQQRQQQ